MSLLREIESSGPRKPRPNLGEQDDGKSPKITSHTDMINIASSVIETEFRVNDEEEREAVEGNYRTFGKISRKPVSNILNLADAERWRSMVDAELRGQLKTINNAQQSPGWKVLDYEVDVNPDINGTNHLTIAVKWVDTNNLPNTKYNNGQPSISVDVTQTMPKEVIEALTNKSGGGAIPEELVSVLKEMAIAIRSQTQKAKDAKD
jgi:hypothetical protein